MPRLIDADKIADAIEWLNEYDFVLWHDVMECIDKVPTVDAEPVRHGRWINHISENGATDGIYCSICDYEVDRDARYKYCPNCGAKMDEVEDADD